MIINYFLCDTFEVGRCEREIAVLRQLVSVRLELTLEPLLEAMCHLFHHAGNRFSRRSTMDASPSRKLLTLLLTQHHIH